MISDCIEYFTRIRGCLNKSTYTLLDLDLLQINLVFIRYSVKSVICGLKDQADSAYIIQKCQLRILRSVVTKVPAALETSKYVFP